MQAPGWRDLPQHVRTGIADNQSFQEASQLLPDRDAR